MNIKILFVLLFFGGSLIGCSQKSIFRGISSYQPPDGVQQELNQAFCSKQIKLLLRKMGSLNRWTRVVDPEDGFHLYNTSTEKFGEWLEFVIDTKTRIAEVRKWSHERITTYSFFSIKNCSVQTKTVRRPVEAVGPKVITDAKLKKMISVGDGIVYVWSPSMDYSMRFLPRFANYSALTGIQFHALMDPRMNNTMIKMARKTYNIPARYFNKFDSVELYMRLYRVHFPTTYVFSHGKIHPQPITGVMEESQMGVEISRRLYELKK